MKNEINFNIIDNDNVSQIPRNVNIPFLSYDNPSDLNNSKEEKRQDKIPTFDLNNLFKFSFSYNFEILKSLLETLILNQKAGQKEFLKMKKDYELKINEIESSIIDMKIKLSNPQFVEELKKEKERILEQSEQIRKKIIREKNLKLQAEKENKSNMINNLTVSTIFIFIYIYF